MSRYYVTYNEYLGSQRCCNLRGQGPPGPQGPQGPAAVGPMGSTGYTGYTGPTGKFCKGPTGPQGPPSGLTGPTGCTGYTSINSDIQLATYSSPLLTIPKQNVPLAYYYVTLNAGDVINSISLTSLPSGYTAVVFINGPYLSGSATIGDTNGSISGINYRNLYTNITLQPVEGEPRQAILKIINNRETIYGELTPMYNN